MLSSPISLTVIPSDAAVIQSNARDLESLFEQQTTGTSLVGWDDIVVNLSSRAGIPIQTEELDLSMHTTEAIQARRSIKKFTDRAVTKEEMEKLLDAAVLAPNHKLTNPWRFYVLGPESRYAYGMALGARKAKKIEDPEKATAMRENVANEHRALPGMIAVAMLQSDDPEMREEDYAATLMAVQNLTLAAIDAGLGTAIKSGAIMNDPAAREASGVPDGQRIVAIVNVGTPAEAPVPKTRDSASSVTIWRP